MGKQMYT